MIPRALLALALFAAIACGKYGPPVRGAAEPNAARPADSAAPVSAAPAPGDTEQCEDPNTPAQSAGKTP